jgi:hypothetical protein
LLRMSEEGLDGIDKFVTNRILCGFQSETLGVLGVSPPRILEGGEGHFHIRAQKVIAPSVIHEVPPKWALDFLRTELMPKIVQDRPVKRTRLYVSRSDANTRRIVNEADVMNLLSGLGFSTVTLSGKSVSEQATLFASAELVVAPHGSGLTNLVFCDPGTKVIELFSPTYINPGYWALSDALGHDYFCFLGNGQMPSEPPKGHNAEQWFYSFIDSDRKYGRDLFVNIESLRILLESLG